MLLKALFLGIVLTGCQTMGPNGEPIEAPPTIDAEIPLEEAIDASIQFGGKVLTDTKVQIKKRQAHRPSRGYLLSKLSGKVDSYRDRELVNAMHLYHASASVASVKLFGELVRSDRKAARVLGWNLAANMPSRSIARAMDTELSRLVTSGEEDKHLYPQVAMAARANRLTSAYTFMRRGLMEKGDDEFAKAMIKLAPKRAATDFLEYMSKASVEDLRQLNQKTVNIYSCMVALRHLLNYPELSSHAQFHNLFFYAVSRNQGLAELAHFVIEASIPRHQEHLAILLSRLPIWTQVAYIEGVKRSKSPHALRLLAALKEVSGQKEVVEEIKLHR